MLMIAVKCHRHLPQTNMTSNKQYLRNHRCERTNMAYRCKMYEAVNIPLHRHYTYVCTVFKVTGINTENKSANLGIHKWS